MSATQLAAIDAATITIGTCALATTAAFPYTAGAVASATPATSAACMPTAHLASINATTNTSHARALATTAALACNT